MSTQAAPRTWGPARAAAVESIAAKWRDHANLAYEPTALDPPGAPDKIFSVAHFGAVGDGKTDDGPSIRRALAAATAAAPGSLLRFEPRTYFLGRRRDHRAEIVLQGCDGLLVDGCGARLIVPPPNTFFLIERCRNLILRGFVCDFDRPIHTQGMIASVNSTDGSFELAIHDGYPFDKRSDPTTRYSVQQWGTPMDAHERHRKWGIGDHLFLDGFERLPGRPGSVRVTAAGRYRQQVRNLSPGDRFAINVVYPWEGGQAAPGPSSNISVSGSSDCVIEDLTFFGGQGMNMSLSRNTGPITVRGMTVTFKPGTRNIISTWKDGMHCKFNRGPITVEHCYFEGLLDDSINISTMAEFAQGRISDDTFLLSSNLQPEDEVLAYDPMNGRELARPTVLRSGSTKETWPTPCLFMHPPFKTPAQAVLLERQVSIPRQGETTLRVGIGMDPRAKGSDGATFSILSGQTVLWSQHCSWSLLNHRAFTVDLEALRGQTVPLRFQVDAGPQGNTHCDWAFWTKMELLTAAGPEDLIRLDESSRMGIIEGDGSTTWLAINEPRQPTISGAVIEVRTPAWETQTVTFDRPIPEALPGTGRESTRFYNLSSCGRGSRIRRNVFAAQRRHALLIRAPDCVFAENVVDHVGGSGVWAGNEIISFEEGPLPSGLVVEGNTFRSTQHAPIMVRIASLRPPSPILESVIISGNRMTQQSTRGVSIQGVMKLVMADNEIEVSESFPANAPMVDLSVVKGGRVDRLRLRDGRTTPGPRLRMDEQTSAGALKQNGVER